MGKAWVDMLLSFAPMLIFIGVWALFLSRTPWFSKQYEYYARHQRHMEKTEELLGRIAAALERR